MNILEQMQGGFKRDEMHVLATGNGLKAWRRRVATYNALLAQQLGAVDISVIERDGVYVVKTDIPDFVPFEPTLASAKELIALGEMSLMFADAGDVGAYMTLTTPGENGSRASGRYAIPTGTDEMVGMYIISGCLDFYLRCSNDTGDDLQTRINKLWGETVV